MSHRIAAKITGVAGYVPPKVVTNADLEKMVATNDEWIRTRTGISERHAVEGGTASSHLATEAAKVLLAQTNTDPADIDMIVVASVTPDMMFPATACLVQDRIGAKKAWGFDLSAACSGFAYALTVGAQFVGSGAHKKVLVIGSDTMTSILDYTDRATCVLFGDGAGAVLVEPAEPGEGILDFTHDVDGSGGQYLLHARRRFSEPCNGGNRRKAHALRSSGGFAGLQVRSSPHGGGRRQPARAQRFHEQGSRARRAAPGQPSYHSRHAGTSRSRRFQSDGQHRQLWKHHGGHNSLSVCATPSPKAA